MPDSKALPLDGETVTVLIGASATGTTIYRPGYQRLQNLQIDVGPQEQRCTSQR